MKVVRQTELEMVCEELYSRLVLAIMLFLIALYLIILLPVVLFFIHSPGWELLLLILLIVGWIAYTIFSIPLAETIVLNRVSDQVFYERRLLIGVRRKYLKLSDIRNTRLQISSASRGSKKYRIFITIPSGEQELATLYGGESHRCYQEMQAFILGYEI